MVRETSKPHCPKELLALSVTALPGGRVTATSLMMSQGSTLF